MRRSGFTLVELLIVVAILLLLATAGAVNLVNLQSSSYIDKSVTTIIADLKEQQVKAMSGFTEGQSSGSSYGVYLENSRYTVFRGTAYTATHPSNFVVNLDGAIQITNIQFPSSQIVFSQTSGEVVGYVEGSNSFTIRNNASGKEKLVTMNKYGVVTDVQ